MWLKPNGHHQSGATVASPTTPPACMHRSPRVSLTKKTPPLTSCVASFFVDLSQADFSTRRLDFFSFFLFFLSFFFFKSRSSSKLEKDYF